jgi:hypothetical protein
VLAAVAGVLAGGSGSKGKAAAAFTNSASAGPLELAFPAGWQRMAAPPQIPGLAFANPLVLAPPSPPGARLDAGTVAAGGPTLLPAALLALLPAPPGPGAPVRIGGLQALRYRGLTPRGLAGPLTVYVVPTTQGVLTLACAPGSATATAFAAQCDQVVATAKVVGATPFPLGPSPTYAAALRTALAGLAAARRPAEARLAAATSAGAQASADRDLSAAYTRASRQVAAASGNPLVTAAGGQVSAALAAIARAYQSSAAAAVRVDQAGYAAGGRAVAAAGAAAARALAGLAALGYKVSG